MGANLADPLYCTIPPRRDGLAIPWLGGLAPLKALARFSTMGRPQAYARNHNTKGLAVWWHPQGISPSSQLTVALRIYLMCSATLVPFQFYRRQSVALVFRLGSLTAMGTIGLPFLLAARTCNEPTNQ